MFVLLDKGIPWDVIQNLSQAEVNLILGIESAVKTKEVEDQEAEMRIAGHKMRQ
tara:strand:+ start:489 stop:650 length:162 start_codon:yes stop_codon:yes gene_type:complete